VTSSSAGSPRTECPRQIFGRYQLCWRRPYRTEDLPCSESSCRAGTAGRGSHRQPQDAPRTTAGTARGSGRLDGVARAQRATRARGRKADAVGGEAADQHALLLRAEEPPRPRRGRTAVRRDRERSGDRMRRRRHAQGPRRSAPRPPGVRRTGRLSAHAGPSPTRRGGVPARRAPEDTDAEVRDGRLRLPMPCPHRSPRRPVKGTSAEKRAEIEEI
jgi:hypothetical protein